MMIAPECTGCSCRCSARRLILVEQVAETLGFEFRHVGSSWVTNAKGRTP